MRYLNFSGNVIQYGVIIALTAILTISAAHTRNAFNTKINGRIKLWTNDYTEGVITIMCIGERGILQIFPPLNFEISLKKNDQHFQNSKSLNNDVDWL